MFPELSKQVDADGAGIVMSVAAQLEITLGELALNEPLTARFFANATSVFAAQSPAVDAQSMPVATRDR